MQVVALWTEQVCGIGGNGVELRLLDGGDDDRTADGIHAGIGNTWGDELTLNGERTEIVPDFSFLSDYTLFGGKDKQKIRTDKISARFFTYPTHRSRGF